MSEPGMGAAALAGETGAGLAALLAHASARIGHVAASHFNGMGTEMLVEVSRIMHACTGAVKVARA